MNSFSRLIKAIRALVLMLSILLTGVGARAANGASLCGLQLSNLTEAEEKQVLASIAKLASIRLSHQTELHKEIFGTTDPRKAGADYCRFLKSRVSDLGLDFDEDSKWQIGGQLASYGEGAIAITKLFLSPTISDILRLSTLIHEAKHYDPASVHDPCPVPFLDRDGNPLKSQTAGEPLEALRVCDAKANGSYGVELVWLNNVAQFCESCSEVERSEARKLLQLRSTRILDRVGLKMILSDRIWQSGSTQHFAEYERFKLLQEPERFKRVKNIVPAIKSNLMPGLNSNSLPMISRMIGSTVKLNNLSCSGVFISNTGYLLTAAHCLPAGLFNLMPSESGGYSAVVALSKARAGDKILAASTQNGTQDQGIDARVIIAGRGYPYQFPVHGAPPDVLKSVYDGYDDFAILKFDQTWVGHQCAKIDSRAQAPGQFVISVGFPFLKTQERADEQTQISSAYFKHLKDPQPDFERYDRNHPDEARDKDFPQYISTGLEFDSASHTNLAREYMNLDAPLYDGFFPGNEFMFLTSIGYAGMSGGGVYSAAGSLIGINSGTMGGSVPLDAAMDYKRGGTPPAAMPHLERGLGAVRLSYIVERIRSELGNNAVKEIFSCP